MKSHFKFLILFVLFSSIAFGQKNFIDQPYIEVTGQVEKEIIPDEIYLRIELDESDKKGRISIEKQENLMIKKLKSLGLDLDKDFSVLDFSGYYKRKFLSSNEVTKRKSYQLIVHDGKTLGEVFKTLDDLDVSNIMVTKVDHSNIEALKRENKINALSIAKNKANDYALVIEQSIGKALYIQESQNYNYRNNVNMLNEVAVTAYGMKRSTDESISDINIKPIIIQATILARFELN